jgi:endoglucanase
MVTLAKSNGMYVIIDWHILDDGNPNTYIAEAKTFFTTMSAKYKNETHVLYEICNEPNGGVDWNSIKTYADQIISLIRANDKEAMILLGTPEWSN